MKLFKSQIHNTLYFLILFFSVKSQINFVPNPSAETYTQCPNNLAEIGSTGNWHNAHSGSSDYFNSCNSNLTKIVSVPLNYFGYQQPLNAGQGYLGLTSTSHTNSPNYREYIQTALDSQLIAGRKYYISFYVSLADSCRFGSDGMGAYISTKALSAPSTGVLNVFPQIFVSPGAILDQTTSWMKIQGAFIAKGGESYITIGNFKNDESTKIERRLSIDYEFEFAYYYIDEICLSPDPQACNVPINVGIQENVSSGGTFCFHDTYNKRLIFKYCDVGTIVKIKNVDGVVVKEVNISDDCEISDSNLPFGLYLIEIHSCKTGIVRQKLIVGR